ncbi:MAG: D-alanyl-D-alanine carboxypeptidase family protein [Actinomycetota bacterium]
MALLGAGGLTVVSARGGSTTPTQATSLTDDEVGRLPDAPMPGVADRSAVPTTTGNRAADERIRDVAVSRGYRLRGEPLDPMSSYQGRALQQRAIDDLQAMQSALSDDTGTTLTLTSAHRSAARQRELFRSQLASSALTLRGRSVSNSEIAAGLADDVLNHAMRIAAPPGFSRHHTGLVIDVSSGGVGGFGFVSTTAYEWLTRDDYANAMAHGWVPSYPPNASGQGPEPEPWEWAWIGRDAAACARAGTCAFGSLDRAHDGTVDGWAATPDDLAPFRYRLVTADDVTTFTPLPAIRIDLEVVYGGGADQLGFSAALDVPTGARWACVEARSASGTPWSRIGCLDLS